MSFTFVLVCYHSNKTSKLFYTAIFFKKAPTPIPLKSIEFNFAFDLLSIFNPDNVYFIFGKLWIEYYYLSTQIQNIKIMNATQKNAEAIDMSEVQNTNCKKEWSKPAVNNLSEIVETEMGGGPSYDGSIPGS